VIHPLPILAALLVAAAAMPSPARAWCQMTSANVAPIPGDPCPTEGVPLQWDRPCMSYAIDGRGSTDLDLEVVRGEAALSFAQWTQTTCPGGQPSDMQVLQLAEPAWCRYEEFNRSGGNVNVVAFVDDWSERDLPRTAYALTTVWHDTRTGEILDADMLINEELGPYAVCPPGGCTSPGASRPPVDLRNVLTHEVGHFFGLAHTDMALDDLPREEWPTMAPSAMPGDTFMRILHDDDVEGFCSIYPPGSMTGECSFEPLGGLTLDCEADTGSGRGGRCEVAAAPGAPQRAAHAGAGAGLLLLLALTATRRARRS
jgi:hypothetical protein